MNGPIQLTAKIAKGRAEPAPDIFGDGSLGRIKLEALHAFYEHGYHGTSVRTLAKAAGISVPALYHHFASKQDILFALIRRTMEDLISGTERALETSPAEPPAQLRAIVRAHVLFHTDRREESFIGNTELRAFDAEHRQAVISQRDHQQRLFDSVVDRGCDQDVFATSHPKEASRAVVTMCTAVATWYSRKGPFTPAQIASIYEELSLSTVGYSA